MIQVKRLGHATFKTPDLERIVDYWNRIIGLTVVDKDKNRAFLATKYGEEAIAVEAGDHAGLVSASFQVAPGTDLGDVQKALSKHGVAGEIRSDISPGVAKAICFTDPKGTQVEVYARGLRNSFDIAWDSEGRLFAADNMPDFGPPEEFNLVEPGGEHGYPWYDCDACFPVPEGISLVPPIHTFVAHSAPTGVVAYNDDEFPGYFDSLFVTLWSAFPEAQRIVWFGPGGEETATFATGFAAPIDLTVGPDGALYVADWATGILFRIATIGE